MIHFLCHMNRALYRQQFLNIIRVKLIHHSSSLILPDSLLNQTLCSARLSAQPDSLYSTRFSDHARLSPHAKVFSQTGFYISKLFQMEADFSIQVKTRYMPTYCSSTNSEHNCTINVCIPINLKDQSHQCI